MKKVVSLFLTVVMALSMFSCLSVMAGAAETDLVVDQEYRIPSGTTVIFVPEKSGCYEFASNGEGDPCIEISCKNGSYRFDDQVSRDFLGVVELEAGEEVSCYLYNYNSDSDCVFTITKMYTPVSMDVNFVESIEIIENIDGNMSTDYIYNEDTDEEIEVQFFRYYTPEVYTQGNTITLGYEDGRSVVYTCNGMEYIDENGDVLPFDYDTNQSYDTPWTLGSNNYITFSVLGAEDKVPVTIVENPVESVEFIPVTPFEFIENTDGYWRTYHNPETDKDEKVYIYAEYDIYQYGNVVRVNYTDGSVIDYTYGRIYDEENGRYNYEWFDKDGNLLLNNKLDYYSSQITEPWTVGGDNYFVLEYMNRKTNVPVSIIKNPVESIEFIPAEPYEKMENTGGYYEDWRNPETGEWETVYFYNFYYLDRDNNILRVNYTDGTTTDYTYSYKYDEENDWYNDGWYDEAGNELPYDRIRSYDYQSVNPWKPGGDNYFIVKYLEKETQVPVKVFENPVESISVTLANPLELVENCDGYMENDWIWDDSVGEDILVEYFYYYSPSIYQEGNSITVNYKDGTSDIFVYDDWAWEFENAEGDSIWVETYSSQNYRNRWTLGSENYMTVRLEDYDVETKVPVTIVENPYESIEFIPAEPLVIDEYTHGYWEIYGSDGEERTYKYSSYKVVNKEGNVIKLTKKDGTTEIYTYSSYNYEDKNGEYLNYSVLGNTEDWCVGEDNTFTIRAKGVTSEYNLTIVENTNIVYNSKFVAEMVSEDSCIITDIYVDEDEFDGILEIPEEINGYKVIGVEDGVLGRVDDLKEITLPSSFGMVSEYLFEDCYYLEKINVSEDNAVFESVNGVLYNEALTEIVCCPEAFNGDLIIKAGVTEFPDNLIYCLGNAASIEVEEGNTVFAFEDGVLYDAEFKKIYIAVSPDADFEMKSTVTEISDYAFRGNDTIESVKFAPGVTEITYYSFANCSSLKNVELPSSLVSIEEKAFVGDSALSSLTLPASTKEIGSQAFGYCTSLAKINLNEGLESMGNYVFSESAIERIVLPDSLTNMGYCCFSYSPNLSDVTIGKGLTEIPSSTFSGCSSIKEIVIPENITALRSGSFSGTSLSTLPLHDKITDISGAFYDCNNLTEVNIPDNIVYIDGAFGGCKNLTYAYVGSGVRSMQSAFSGCDKLEKIDFAEGFNAEMDWAFSSCDKLTEIKFPSTVTEISYREFSGCTNLVNIDIPDNLYKVEARSLNDTSWYDNQADGNVYLEHVLYDYKGKMPKNYTLVVEDGTKSIADEAVTYYDELVGVELPEGLKYIGFVAFEGCENLTDITIPASVEFIDDYAFGYKYGRTDSGRGYVKYGDITIRGWSGSEAERYAKDNGFTFVSMGHIHNAGDWITDTDATCTVAGSKYKACTICGEKVETDVIPAKGHTEVKDAAIAATCTATGKTEGSHCSVCNAVIKAQTTVPAKGHTEVKDAAIAATCTTAGKTEGSHCSVCNAVIKAQTTVPAKGHTEVKDAAIAATCTATGKTEGSHCSVCNAVIKAQTTVPAKGHTEVKDAAIAATCTATGKTEGSHCSVCNAVIKAQTTVPAKGHTEVKDAAVAATCTETGLTEGSHCSVCNAVIKAQEAVPAIGHNASEWIIDKNANCTENGSKHIECTVCGETLENSEILATGHTEVKDAAVEATCTETGLTEGSHCSVCNATIKAQETVAAKGHTSSDWKTDKKATVNSAGKKHKECTECGKVLKTAKISQLKCSKPKLSKIENTEYGVKITWGKVSGADKYRVYRKTSKSDWKYIGSTTKTGYTDKTAKSGTKYYYAIKAQNEAGNSSLSSSLSKYYLADTTLSTPKSTKSGITLKWKKVTGADGYMVYRKTGTGSYSRIATVKGNSKVTYTDKSAKKGKKYTYKIKAYKSKAYSAYSNTKTITDKY